MAGSDGRSEKEKMLAGVLYRAVGPELAADNLRADRLLRAYNATGAEEVERRIAIVAELLGAMGEGVVVRPPFHCDYGYNIRLGRGTFVNFGCVFLDVAAIELGDNCQVGPWFRSTQLTTRAIRRRGSRVTRAACPCGSAETSGSAAAQSSCPGSASGMTPSWAPVAW